MQENMEYVLKLGNKFIWFIIQIFGNLDFFSHQCISWVSKVQSNVKAARAAILIYSFYLFEF